MTLELNELELEIETELAEERERQTTLYLLDNEVSQLLHERKNNRKMIDLMSEQLKRKDRQIHSLEEQLLKFEHFDELRSQFMRTIYNLEKENQQLHSEKANYLRTINELNARIAELERSRSTLSKKCRDLGQLLQDYFDNRDNRKEQEVTT